MLQLVLHEHAQRSGMHVQDRGMTHDYIRRHLDAAAVFRHIPAGAHLEAVVGVVGVCGPQEVELHIVGLILQDLPLKAEACTNAQQQGCGAALTHLTRAKTSQWPCPSAAAPDSAWLDHLWCAGQMGSSEQSAHL